MRSYLLNQLLEEAKQSPRKRAFHMLSEEDADRQIMINLFLKGSYARPHKHTLSQSGETFQSIYGQFLILQFADKGQLFDSFVLEKDRSITVPLGVYHTAISITDSACLLETKNGKYDPTDKVFLDQSSEEDGPYADRYLMTLTEMGLLGGTWIGPTIAPNTLLVDRELEKDITELTK